MLFNNKFRVQFLLFMLDLDLQNKGPGKDKGGTRNKGKGSDLREGTRGGTRGGAREVTRGGTRGGAREVTRRQGEIQVTVKGQVKGKGKN